MSSPESFPEVTNANSGPERLAQEPCLIQVAEGSTNHDQVKASVRLLEGNPDDPLPSECYPAECLRCGAWCVLNFFGEKVEVLNRYAELEECKKYPV